MKLKTLHPIAAALVIASLTPAAMAETSAEHPAVQVAQTWSTHGIDANTFIVGHPAGLQVLTLEAGTAASSTLHSPSSSRSADAQARAAALLNPPVISGTSSASEQVLSAATDAQASAAALLSGSRIRTENAESIQLSDGPMAGDAQSQAAALLSNSSAPVDARRSHAMSSKIGL